MTDPRKERDGGSVTPGSGRRGTERQGEGSGQGQKPRDGRTSGTNRDFDESGESVNQGHGHPREERQAGS